MATFKKLPSGNFNAQIRIRGERSRSKTFASLADAQAWASKIEKQIDTGKAHSLTMADMVLRYSQARLQDKSSRHLMTRRMEQVAGHFPQPFLSVTRSDVNAYRLMRLAQVSGPTVREDLQIINKLYRWAEREMIFGDLDIRSPAKNIALPPPGKPRSRVIERSELETLMGALSPTMARIVEVAYETAMRRSEILKLTPRVLHLEDRCLSVIDGKTGDRVVPLTSRAIELLKEASKVCKGQDDRLFPVTPHAVSTAVRRARKQVGLDDDVRMHQLRHTRISMVARKGFNQAQIMMVSGHRDSRSVQRYTHLNVKDVIQLLD